MRQNPTLEDIFQAFYDMLAEREKLAKGLLHVLRKRFEEAPDDLRAAILAVKEVEPLEDWIDLARQTRTLREFRQKAGL